jgi:hypothetical protein
MKLFETYANVYRIAMFQRLPQLEQRRQPDNDEPRNSTHKFSLHVV